MTTASVLDNTGAPIMRGSGAATALDYGSGHVVVGEAFDPGLVYDSTDVEWIQYGCAIGQIQLITPPGFCDLFPSIDASDLNYPTIAVGDLAGTQTITRTVTNVTERASNYDVAVQAPAGFTVSVNPAELVVAPHHSQSYTVTITRTTAPLGTWAFGSLTWTDKAKDKRDHSVRSNIAVRPVALAAPAALELSGASGSSGISAKVGYTGTLNASVVGLVGALVNSMLLDTAGPSFNPNAPAPSIQTGMVPVTIPAGTTMARFATFDADYPPNTDIDLFVYLVNGSTRTLVGSSGGGSAEEAITLDAPMAGSYEFYVDLFALGSGTTLTAQPHHWVLDSSAAGNATVTPASQPVTTDGTASLTLNWTGLTAGLRHLGLILYSDRSATIGRTVVRVDA